jgi:hypothetical protein
MAPALPVFAGGCDGERRVEIGHQGRPIRV